MKTKSIKIFVSNLDIFVLIAFYNEKNNIYLKQVNFFKKESDVNKFLKQAKRELIDNVSASKEIIQMEKLIKSYFEGKNVNLYKELQKIGIKISLISIFPTKFSQDVIKTLLNYYFGDLTSYFEIGKKLNSKAYRAIGNVLKSNPIPLIIPCHRVIKKNGKIGGFMGKQDESWQVSLKKNLLNLEGHHF
ncbi:MAG: methylated-DNA--[protein]-cysteine S-methyltransferase [Candidatus Lokiarchaeota archaeon]